MMLYRKSLLGFWAWVFPVVLIAQNPCGYVLKGRLREAQSNQPIAFANIWIKEIQKGTTTDEQGFFTLKELCRGRYTLELSHIECRHKTETINIEGHTEGVFVLEHDDKLLENVVIREQKVALAAVQSQTALSKAELARTQGLALADMLTAVAGVTTLNTGATISKPVVQGLHSDRVLIFNNGVRQEGQQWGIEHAPEIDPLMADEIKVVKGASSIKYGVGAIGGVVVVNAKPLRDSVGQSATVHLMGFSNGRGGLATAFFEQRTGHWAWRAQATAKKTGTLTTPQYRLENMGNEELNGSFTIGYKKEKWQSELFVSHFYTKIGILKSSHIGNLTDLRLAIERGRPYTDAPFSYAIQRPAQRVNHTLAKWQTQWKTDHSGDWTLLVTGQYNLREEFDAHKPGGRKPTGFDKADIAFELPSAATRLDWQHKMWRYWQGSAGVDANFQLNNTYSGALIPDFWQTTVGAYWVERWRQFPKPWEIEWGLRYDWRALQVDSTRFGQQNTAFQFQNLSANVGTIYHIGQWAEWRVNAATAWRSPNVNELFSNGVHHGTASFERGNPTLKPERAYNFSTQLTAKWGILTADIQLYANKVADFIYLKPDTTPVLTIRGAFPAFNYQQTDALLRGGDLSLTVALHRQLNYKIKGATVRAVDVKQQKWLPLMPADRVEQMLEWSLTDYKNFKNTHLSVSALSVARQNRIPTVATALGEAIEDYAAAPAGYTRFDASFGTDWTISGHATQLNITVINVFNTRYRDYLDRFRYFTDAVGRNVLLKWQFTF